MADSSIISRKHLSIKTLNRRKQWYGFFFVVPAFLFIFSFMLYPVVYSFYMSLHNYNYVYDTSPTFAGIGNFLKAIQELSFRTALKNTIVFSFFYFILVMGLSLTIALILFHIKRLHGLFRTAIFLPIVVPVSLSALVFLWILQENYGLLNYLLRDVLGLTALAKPWLNVGSTAMVSIIGVSLWATIGFETILFLGGLQTLSREMLEAAEVDGANGFKRIFYVIFPNLKETYILTGIWAILHGLKVFVEPNVMTNGGPGNSTLVVYQEVYYNAFNRFEMGYASAEAYILAILALAFSLLNMYINRAKD
jgi:ABC-type sugar transport systems, permease components